MRYFFHTRLHDAVLDDPEGVEMDGIDTVRTEAIAGARDIIAERIRTGTPLSIDTTFEVTDETGTIVLVVPFAAVLLSAIAPPPIR